MKERFEKESGGEGAFCMIVLARQYLMENG